MVEETTPAAVTRAGIQVAVTQDGARSAVQYSHGRVVPAPTISAS
ncbi:MAG: hypothetical protein SV966_12155 [Actinomycetota bacterium]|nr:hypothetical protein [Actinomycetota bacterium]